MRILLTGAGGQLGRELQRRLRGTDFLATDAGSLDVSDEAAVVGQIGAYRPDVVIHAAAWTKVDAAEDQVDATWRINATGTQNVARACRDVQAALAYISTDYVFDGRLGRSYNELDEPNPLSIYGKSKYAGEILARQLTDRLYVLRTAWLYGDGPNFVRTMLRLGNERDAISVVDDQVGCPTSTVDLAEAVLQLILTECFGTYHVVNRGQTTWYGLAQKIFALTGNTKIKINPVTTEQFHRPAPRPAYAPLDTRLLQQTLGWTLQPWEQALEEYLRRDGIDMKGEAPS